MKHWDQGLGSIGLLALATALAMLLTVGIPITVSKEGVELKDWLGFAGNVLGAFMTLIAAVIAWRAVQHQISAQQEANLLNILTREEDRLESEIHACEVCADLLMKAIAIPTTVSPTEHVAQLHKLGFAVGYNEMRGTIEAKLKSGISPELSRTVTNACSNLMYAATWLDSPTTSSVEAVFALKALREAQARMDHVLHHVIDRQQKLHDRCGAIRSRIEASLDVLSSDRVHPPVPIFLTDDVMPDGQHRRYDADAGCRNG